MIPLIDLGRQYRSIKVEIDAAIKRVLDSAQFVMGEEITSFEQEYADYIGADYCVSTSSGTSALILALLAIGVKPGDEVITTTLTFAATAEAITASGAIPVFVDIDEKTYNLDIQNLEQAITSKTKAIIPVHLYGLPCEMQSITELAKANGILVVEDASQAHGAKYHNTCVGIMGDVGCFSFYPSKNLGAYGDAGAVVTNNLEIAQRIRLLRDHGRKEKYVHEISGFNARMDAIQAAILRVKLPLLDQWNARRSKIALSYSNLLKNDQVILPYVPIYCNHVYHLFVIGVPNRDHIRERLLLKGIKTGVHYPVPLHLQPAFSVRGDKSMTHLNRSEGVVSRVLSIPMFPELTDLEINRVSDAILKSINE